MSGTEARGGHVVLDYIGYTPPVEGDGDWMLQLLRSSVQMIFIVRWLKPYPESS